LRSLPLRIAAIAVATALGPTACGGGGSASPGPEPSGTSAAVCGRPSGIVSVGESIPSECSFERVGGGMLRLSALAGKPAVLNFWASWCTFCIEEMPDLQKVYASLAGRVEFVGADLLGVEGETRGAAEQFARSTGVRYPLIFDEGGVLYGHFSARLLMPVTVFIRSDGIVAHKLFGPLNEKSLRDILATELGLE
jgi:cytochrome c biogenesis protein CcmG, thiol:disulfide interchange protein DsbE